MSKLKFVDNKGTFTLDDPDLSSYMYFPLANEKGIMSAVTPDLSGDIKMDQNTFLLEPVSSENLHNNKSSRNFWVYVEGRGAWSVTGRSALQQAGIFTDKKEDTKLEAGIMWHSTQRKSGDCCLKAVCTTFVPLDFNVELTKIEITNISDNDMNIRAVPAIPLYARSASNIRDHRHVTSLLHRTEVTDSGVCVFPTLTFDERGHNLNTVYYIAEAAVERDGKMYLPSGFCPVVEEFIGEGGSFENPGMIIKNEPFSYKQGDTVDGYETIAAMDFEFDTLRAGETRKYIVALGYGSSHDDVDKIRDEYLSVDAFDIRLRETQEYWQKKINVSYISKDRDFDNWMHWVNFQPMLRRIYGCSFLPHHDYGKGGRGWRDLWQDCLALLLMEPENVRGMLLDNFGGVRFDGTNATIIGNGQGEFIADRNNITRVWMDHGAWPYITTKLYMDLEGDIEFLTEENSYFKDIQVERGEGKDTDFSEDQGTLQKDAEGSVYTGTILEHMLIQHVTAFYDVGAHNHIRLRGADWNDGLDMADENGESVAFTALYGGNLGDLADDIIYYEEKTGNATVRLAKELSILIDVDESVFDDVEKKQALLSKYCSAVRHSVSGEKYDFDCDLLAGKLKAMSDWIVSHIRNTEWITDREGYSWFNGYYDNHKNPVEGDNDLGTRMILTGQVFTIMSGTADDEQCKKISKAADKYLYDEAIGGYRLNTDFHEIKTDMGRMFGFAYGHKENGAVFCHMAVMFANALYKRGLIKEGYKAIHTLFAHCNDYDKSGIYPGVPEYINQRGRGMYHYLTGAASWLLLTVLSEMYGIKAKAGDLTLKPKLLSEQFEDGKASVGFTFAGHSLDVTYVNEKGLEPKDYSVKSIEINGDKYSCGCIIERKYIENTEGVLCVTAYLG